jgi:phosphoglycolate phosphatase
MTLRLAIFDCDGTLVDSQHGIVAAMERAFIAEGLVAPARPAILSIVGLSLREAVAGLLPEGDIKLRGRVADHYKNDFSRMRQMDELEHPLFDGIALLLDKLDEAGWLLGVATGNSDRGLKLTLDAHGLGSRFVTLQTADRHPSKPDPSMIHKALAETGVAPEHAVMIGDTSFDMMMGRAAGVRALGVGWGYHPPEELFAAGALSVAMDSAQLAAHIGVNQGQSA